MVCGVVVGREAEGVSQTFMGRTAIYYSWEQQAVDGCWDGQTAKTMLNGCLTSERQRKAARLIGLPQEICV